MPPCGDFHLFEPLFLRRLFFLSVLYHFLRVVADLRINTYIARAYYINVYKLIKLRIERVID